MYKTNSIFLEKPFSHNLTSFKKLINNLPQASNLPKSLLVII